MTPHFAYFGPFVFERNITMDQLSMYQLASQILYLKKFSPCQARNAYSAVLLIPGWDQLQFCPLLHQCKRSWNHSPAKYSTFWDADVLLKKLLSQPLNWQSVEHVRNRLIIVCRILNLFSKHRSCQNVEMQKPSW